MTDRKFYKTRFIVEILSEEPIPESWGLDQCMAEASVGDFSGDVKSQKATVINGRQAALALLAQRSDPGFFGLTEKGEDEEV